MTEWILILTSITRGNSTVAPVSRTSSSVVGFKTEEACLKAGLQWQIAMNGGGIEIQGGPGPASHSYLCVPDR